MRLWLLRPIGYPDSPKDGPWNPWYDKAFGFVVRAHTEHEARSYADKEAGTENLPAWRVDANRMERNRTNPGRIPESWDHPWLQADLSTCVPLTDDGEPGIIIRDFAAA